jgi:hypothetical protein
MSLRNNKGGKKSRAGGKAGKKKRQPSKPWVLVYYKDDDKTAPAREGLQALPAQVRVRLRAIVSAVRDRPPPSFPLSGPQWRLLTNDRRKGRVDVSGIFYARDKHGDWLYRLYCVLDSDAEQHGLPGPAVVMIDCGVKPDKTELPDSFYAELRRKAQRYLKSSPRPVFLPPVKP